MKIINLLFISIGIVLIGLVGNIQGATTTTGGASSTTTGSVSTTTTTTGGKGGEIPTPGTQYVDWSNPPNDVTLPLGTTILFVVANNSGDHNVHSNITPPTLQPFTSPVLNFNRDTPSWSYTFNTPGQYLLEDQIGQQHNQMKLTISNPNGSSESSNSTTTSKTTTATGNSNSNGSDNSSSHHKNNTLSTSTTATTTGKVSTSTTGTNKPKATETPTGNESLRLEQSVYINMIAMIASAAALLVFTL